MLLPWRNHGIDLSQTNGKHRKQCSVGFHRRPPPTLQAHRRPVNLHVYWCFLASDSQKPLNTCWPVGFTAAGRCGASPQLTAALLITRVSSHSDVFERNLRNLWEKSESELYFWKFASWSFHILSSDVTEAPKQWVSFRETCFLMMWILIQNMKHLVLVSSFLWLLDVESAWWFSGNDPVTEIFRREAAREPRGPASGLHLNRKATCASVH